MRSPKTIALIVATFLSSGLVISTSSAMPLSGVPAAAAQTTTDVQNVRWVCGPYRCWRRPGPYYWGPHPYWGPRPYWGYHRWGWRRRWW